MPLILRYMKPFRGKVFLAAFIKLLGTMAELFLPYILDHLLDHIVPTKDMGQVIFWGLLMILTAVICAALNIWANKRAIRTARDIAFNVRQDLFVKTTSLSGRVFDRFGLPSLTSRMTSDSYNVQQFVQSIQVMAVRAPFITIGGIILMMTLDTTMALILCAVLIPLFTVVLLITRHGIPLFSVVQDRLDDIVRIMRENITGIRVVKALTKADFEKNRFETANESYFRSNVHASSVMALPGPLMSIVLNATLAIIVYVGAIHVNAGQIQPGIVLAFLTYFNMILFSVMMLNRLFLMSSKAATSANRIDAVLQAEDDQPVLSEAEALKPHGDEFIRFEHVDFRYAKEEDPASENSANAPVPRKGPGSHVAGNGNEAPSSAAPAASEEVSHTHFAGDGRAQTLYDIDFALREGQSLGIIGPTGSGKSTIVRLLMRFYDADSGGIFLDGKDVRSYDKDELRRQFGVAFQNDTVFHDTLRGNIDFGRGLTEEQIRAATEDAMAASYIFGRKGGLDFMAEIGGANLSGGQKQRLLISRALAGRPRVLILDDSSSALDYKTDAALRKALREHYRDTTIILIAQRVSSIRDLDHILVLRDGRTIGYGTHAELMESCPYYRDICRAQMGALE